MAFMNDKYCVTRNDDEYKSYFHTFKTIYGDDVDGLLTVSGLHKRYVCEKFLDDPIMSRIQRSKYINSVNDWLTSPLYYEQEDDCDEEYSDGTDCECEYYDVYDDEDDCDDNDDGESEPITNQTIGKAMYDEIVATIYSSGFEIDDSKQFKEDFIHFIYTLSDVQQ